MRFRDRSDAGQQLAAALDGRVEGNAVVLALPRGGVPVAAEVARHLGLPLDVIVVRKLGVPSHPEYAMGAIGELGVRVLDGEVIRATGVSDEQLARVDAAERTELDRRALRYRGDRGALPLVGRTAVLVDDGMATGSTALAATQVARVLGASKVVLAVPVAAEQALAELRRAADEVVCVQVPPRFRAVASGTTTSPRPPTRRSSSCWRGTAARASRPPPARGSDTSTWGSWTAMSPSRAA